MDKLLEMAGVTKIYDNGVLANDKVNISLSEAEIHAIAGENGAGKSTIMKILYGLEKKDEGEIFIRGQKVKINSPGDAMGLGIGMVHQHFMLVNQLPVYQNIFLGHEVLKKGLLDKQSMMEKTLALCEQYGMQVDPNALCDTLPVGVAQKVEILKALSKGAQILILDEPTAVLTPQETKELFKQLRLLRKNGCTVIMITHKLKEIISICDRVSIMRRGRFVGCYEVDGLEEEDISRLMIGRDVKLSLDKKKIFPKEEVLTVRNFSVNGTGGKLAVDNISFVIRHGEILGVAGVEGNGQRELVNSVTGLNKQYAGTIAFKGKDIRSMTVKQIRDNGLSHIPEDRLLSGVNADAKILDNLISINYEKNSRFGFVRYKYLNNKANSTIKEYGIRANSCKQKIGMLSGGNMQKVVAAREMETSPALLVADQPTRGVDVGAMEFIYEKLLALREEYSAILLVSADLNEVMSLSDRILVFHEGHITAEITDVEGLSEEQLGRYMLGVDVMERGGGYERE